MPARLFRRWRPKPPDTPALTVAAAWLFLVSAVIADDWGKPLDGFLNVARSTVLCAVFVYVGHRITLAVRQIGIQIEESVDGAIERAARSIIAGSRVENALKAAASAAGDDEAGDAIAEVRPFRPPVPPVPGQRGAEC
jgi:hypothetical protein